MRLIFFFKPLGRTHHLKMIGTTNFECDAFSKTNSTGPSALLARVRLNVFFNVSRLARFITWKQVRPWSLVILTNWRQQPKMMVFRRPGQFQTMVEVLPVRDRSQMGVSIHLRFFARLPEWLCSCPTIEWRPLPPTLSSKFSLPVVVGRFEPDDRMAAVAPHFTRSNFPCQLSLGVLRVPF